MFKKQCSSRLKAAKLKIFLKVENVRLKTEISVQFSHQVLAPRKACLFRTQRVKRSHLPKTSSSRKVLCKRPQSKDKRLRRSKNMKQDEAR